MHRVEKKYIFFSCNDSKSSTSILESLQDIHVYKNLFTVGKKEIFITFASILKNLYTKHTTQKELAVINIVQSRS